MADETKKEEPKYARYEDDPKNVAVAPEGFRPARVTAKEIDPEESRKDSTTLLASDSVVVNADNEATIVKG